MSRKKIIGVNSITFNRQFKDDNDCYEYLSLVKWEYGFICRKCGCKNIIMVKNRFQDDA